MKHSHQQLAVVEATQAGEVLFTLFGGCLFLGDQIPTPLGFLGVFIVIIGIVGNSLHGFFRLDSARRVELKR
ncbi:MAG: multidrug resistance efflux transporter family protein [Streptococcus parasanguinis]